MDSLPKRPFLLRAFAVEISCLGPFSSKNEAEEGRKEKQKKEGMRTRFFF
jgi:hypothetical protein